MYHPFWILFHILGNFFPTKREKEDGIFFGHKKEGNRFLIHKLIFPVLKIFYISSFSVKFSKSHFGIFLEAHNETPRMAESR